ncbi:MAG TPA: methyltransferase domain-containing protein [Candidatus Binatia bacterium]|nr:methyltransferase domain-containing protein [Candidatus Binatia bacterium]
MSATQTLLDVPLTLRQIQEFYSNAAPAYDEMTARYEAKPKRLALQRLARTPGEKHLEVAVGTGTSLAELTTQTGPEGVVGIDLSRAMLNLTRRRLAEVGAKSVPLLLADARHLPFRDASFDSLFNSYMLDLIPTADLAEVLGEFRRVLKTGGRLVLANLTEGEGRDSAFSESWKEGYRADPAKLGGCRPLLASPFLKSAGFVRVRRTYCGRGKSWPTEIITARAPRRTPQALSGPTRFRGQ